MAGYLLDDGSAKRLGSMLRAWESGGISDGRSRRGPGQGNSFPPVNVVQVTGPLDAGGWYPGNLLLWDNELQVYQTLNTCRIREINGAALTAIRYLGRMGGLDAAAYGSSPEIPVYLVQARDAVVSGSGSGSGSGTSGSGSGSSGSGSTIESGSGSGSIDSGSLGSGSTIESGSGTSGISGGSDGSSPCGGSGALLIEVVTNVQCVDGNIVVTKQTIAIPGGVLC